MISNIEGLSTALDNINRKIDLLEEKVSRFSVTGGSNSFVTRLDDNVIIESKDETGGGGGSGFHPWMIFLEELDGDQKKISINGGLLNGILPENYEDVKDISEDASGYVYWEATTNGTFYEKCEVKFKSEKPDTKYEYVKNAFPTKVRGLIGYIYKGAVKYQFLKNDMLMKPAVGFSLNSSSEVGMYDNYWSWYIVYL